MTRSEPLSEAVQARVSSEFPAEARGDVLEALRSYGLEPHEPEVDRVRLAILELAGGESASVLHLVGVAKEDFRDVLSWQAQERGEEHKPTPEETLAMVKTLFEGGAMTREDYEEAVARIRGQNA